MAVDAVVGNASAPIRVVVFGMRCGFTEAVVSRLMVASSPPVAIAGTVIAMPELATIGESLAASGARFDPQLGAVRMMGSRRDFRDPRFRAWLETLGVDAVVAACFPWKLPPWLHSLPGTLCLNVHPSLLPDGRGPEPLFWAFRWGLTETGVTVHQVDDGWDTGPIVAQRTHPVPEGATIPALERALAETGGDLVREALAAARGARAAGPTIAQAAGTGRYAPVPGEHDLQVDTSWAVKAARRFIRGVVPAFGPVTVVVLATGQRFKVVDVVAISPTEPGSAPTRWQGAHVAISFVDGDLLVRLASPEGSAPLHLHLLRSPRE